MNGYDNILPFLNRLLYSFQSGNDLWHCFEKDFHESLVFVNNIHLSTHVSLYLFLFEYFNQNKLLTKYTLACCTNKIFNEVELEKPFVITKKIIKINSHTNGLNFAVWALVNKVQICITFNILGNMKIQTIILK